MTRYLLPLSLVLALPVFAQTPTPVMIRGLQSYFQNVSRIDIYNSRKAAPPVTEPTPPLPNQWRMAVIPISATRTPCPAGIAALNPTPCADPNTTYFEADPSLITSPGSWNTWWAFAIASDDPSLISDISNTKNPPGSKAFAPVLY